MARGRMINSKITRNKAINDLSDDTSRLAFTWLVTFADVDGRTNGDPAIVRSLVFPRRTDVSVERMEAYIQEWCDAGLITWYEADGDLWIAFPSFDENQKGLDRRKEPTSDIPSPDRADKVRTKYVPGTCEVRSNRTEQNRSEVKYAGENQPGESGIPEPEPHSTGTVDQVLWKEIDHAGIILTSTLADGYQDFLDEAKKMPRPREFIEAAFAEAKRSNARPLPAWLDRVTQRCLSQGCMPGEWHKKGSAPPRASPSKPPVAPMRYRNPITGEIETVSDGKSTG
jgi:hypothetical protein